MRTLTILMAFTVLVFTCQPAFSQDTALKKPDTLVVKSDTTVVAVSPKVDITNIPTNTIIYAILGIVAALTAVIAPALQLLLKKIPGASPIGGIIGKILSALTWFQANVHIPEKPPDT